MKVKILFLLFLLQTYFTFASNLFPPMDNGILDREDEPFDYFSYPVSVIGVKDGEFGTEITPEGSLYTGYHELNFYVGKDKTKIFQRVKTLLKGYLPIVKMNFSHQEINYEFTMFGQTLDFKPESNLINFIEVKISNPNNENKKAYFFIDLKKAKGHRVQNVPNLNYSGDFLIDNDLARIGDKIIYLFYPEPKEKKNTRCEIKYEFELKKQETKKIIIKMPFIPEDLRNVDCLRKADFNFYLRKTIKSWENLLNKGMKISISLEKAVNTYLANLIYLFIARDKEDEDFIPKVNEFQYNAFWIRDGSFILRALDVAGFNKEAEESAYYFLKYQTKEGNFESQKGQLDGFGQTLWLFGQHYQLTKNISFAKKVYPSVKKAMEFLKKEREKEKVEGNIGFGLLPISNPGDNELVNGHVVGHDLWALLGVKNAIILAKALNEEKDLKDWTDEYNDYHKCLMQAFDKIVKRTGGYISPAIEEGGNDWGNLKLAWPTGVLSPFDERVTATINMARSKFQEGLMTYNLMGKDFLHHYLTIDIPQTELLRDEQDKVLDTFYSLLLHTTSTHGGFEWCVLPWEDRDFKDNLSPHGCFSGKFIDFFRNMFVREEGNLLHIFSCISPDWIKEGDKIEITNAPTNFGKINIKMKMKKKTAEISLNLKTIEKPERVIIHLPPNYKIISLKTDGKVSNSYKETSCSVNYNTKKVEITFEKTYQRDFCFQKAVEDYKKEYKSRKNK